MRSLSLLFAFLLITSVSSLAQTSSYRMLKNKFKGQPEVHSFSLSGWLGRAVLSMAGEYEFKNAIRELDHVRFMVIPKAAFASQHVSVNGFKKVLREDSFQELAFIRDKREEVSIYLREGNNHKNNYFVLVEEEDEIVAIELKGYIDPALLNPKNTILACKK